MGGSQPPDFPESSPEVIAGGGLATATQVGSSQTMLKSPETLPVSGGNRGHKMDSPAEAGQVKSWVNIVSNKPTLLKHDFGTARVYDGVAIPREILEAPPLWEDLLVGQFLAKAPHVAKIHVIVNKIWPLGDKSLKIDVFVVSERMVKFRIRDEAVRSRILRRGMWNIADVPMTVSKCSPILEETQPEIKTMPLWLTIKNVPHSMFKCGS